MRLFYDLLPGESVHVNGAATITLVDKTGRRGRVVVEAEASVSIAKGALPDAIGGAPCRAVAGKAT